MDKKLKAAAKAYESGYTCSQSVFAGYADELGINQEVAYRIMEGFGGGCGAMQEVCGALLAAFAIISFYSCDGTMNGGKSKQFTYAKVKEAADIFKHEYGGITCREVLHGEKPKAFQCEMKVKDAVLVIERVLLTK